MSLFVSGLPSHWAPTRSIATRTRLMTKQKPSLSIIVPTSNEADNIKTLIRRLERVAALMPLELILVDDSMDDTPAIIRSRRKSASYHIELIHRLPEQRQEGYHGAVMRGFQAARAPWICVMDANLQHPPELIPRLVAQAEETNSDLVMGRRLRWERNESTLDAIGDTISDWLMNIARYIFPERLGDVSDPTTHFFLVRKNAIELNRLQIPSINMLLAILLYFPELKKSELPFEMGKGVVNNSKRYHELNIYQKGLTASYA